MGLMTLKIRDVEDEPFAVGKMAKIELDGQDISRFVRNVNIDIGVDHANVVVLECVGYVDLPEELQALTHIEPASASEIRDALDISQDDLDVARDAIQATE